MLKRQEVWFTYYINAVDRRKQHHSTSQASILRICYNILAYKRDRVHLPVQNAEEIAK
jgi:hypothetical protein